MSQSATLRSAARHLKIGADHRVSVAFGTTAGKLKRSPAQVADRRLMTNTLHTALQDSKWLYTHGGKDYEFQLAKNGTLTGGLPLLSTSWRDVTWRVDAPNEVEPRRKDGRTMLLRCADTHKSFLAVDWDGSPTSGRLKP